MPRKAKGPGTVNATAVMRETLDIRCSEADKELFKKAAEAEGFLRPNEEPNLSAWVLTNLRKIAKKALEK